MADQARAGRMAKRIQSIVATELERNTKDRRLELVTITDTRMTGDLHDASIYYTVRGRTLDERPDVEGVAQALEKRKGYLRKVVGDHLHVRFTPTLTFIHDTMPESSAHMEELLAKARQRDAETSAQRAHATPAGDANPYKTEDDE
ncbi:MAG: 30S ribosome-binding factor RbfA [Corynebacterium sp.]|nr:30S ribosome-binding factor RbfA [Corynebacterium sp.]